MGEGTSSKVSSVFIYVMIAIIVSISFWFIFRTNPIEVERGRVIKGLFEEKFFIDGKTKAKKSVTIVAFATGDIDEIELRKGDLVKKGDLITMLHWDYHKKILSPISGVVNNVFRTYSGPINHGDPLLEIVDLDTLEIVIEPLTSSAMKIKEGAPVEIFGLEESKTYGGKVSRVSRSGFLKTSALGVEEERTEVFIHMNSIPQKILQKIGEAFHVEVAILLSRKEQVLKVPLGALFKKKDQWAAYVIKENCANLRLLEISDKNESEAVVSSGLEEGDEIILFPSDLISDQTLVQ